MRKKREHDNDDALSFLAGGGEVGALMRTMDWSTTSIGYPATWPLSLRNAVRLMFNTGHPMYIWWGEDNTCLYNDPYRHWIRPERHPASLGRPACEVWYEIWDVVGPQIEQVKSRQGATWHEDHLVPITRNGRREDAYWTYSFSAIDDETAPNGIGGVLVICAETTQKVLAERRLASEMQRQQRLFRHAPGFIAVLSGPDHVYEFVSDGYVRLFGEREFIGKTLSQALPELKDAGCFERIEHVYRHGTRLVAEQMFESPTRANGSGGKRFLNFIYEPVFNEDGAVSSVIVEGFDITEQREAQTALAELNATLEARAEQRTRERDRVWHHSPDLLMMMGVDGILREISPAWTRVLGHAPEEVIGHSFFEFVHPDDARATYKAADRGNLSNYINRYMHKDGTPRWISWNTSFEDDIICAYGRDINAEKLASDALELSEARLRTIFETSHLFQGLLTLDGTLVDTNAISLASIGATRADVIGKPFCDSPWFADTPGMRETVIEGIAAAATGQEMRQEIQINLRVGGWRWFDFVLRPVRDGHGNVVAIVPEAMELTERKLAEEALRQSQKLEAMGQLTGGVAHDFNNLLTPIVGGLDMLLRRGFGGKREQRILEGAMQSAEKAKMVVQRLLAFARRQPLQPVAVDVPSLVTGMASLVSSTTGPQIQVVVDVGEQIPPAKADPHQIEMAILNLSVNARDAMPHGGTLRISATSETVNYGHRSRLPPGHYVLISVTDTGIGMDEATLARAIEPFFSTKGIGKGTGLGLSMVHGLASQLGGALVISSKHGVGTNAELWLPVSDEPVAAAEAPGTDAQRNAIGTALLVDDEDLVRSSTADMLTELGYSVVEAASGEDALRVIDTGTEINVLITDHLMPGMSGVDLVRAVRERRPEMPALIVSGFADVDGIAPDLPRLAKPFRQTELAASIENLALAA